MTELTPAGEAVHTASPASHRINLRETLVGVACLTVGVAALMLTHTIDTTGGAAQRFSPRWWPEIVGWIIVLLSLIQIIASLRRTEAQPLTESPPTSRDGYLRLTGALLATIAFCVIWTWVDFRISATLYLATLFVLLGARRWAHWTLVPGAIALGIHLVFGVLFKVPL